jgi:hypothetical protein
MGWEVTKNKTATGLYAESQNLNKPLNTLLRMHISSKRYYLLTMFNYSAFNIYIQHFRKNNVNCDCFALSSSLKRGEIKVIFIKNVTVW